MPEESRILDLLARYKELRLRGQDPTVEELCTEDPELTVELRRRIASMTEQTSFLETSVDLAASAGLSAAPTLPPKEPVAKDHLQPKIQVPGYEILEELGRGGMGVVFKARHLRLGRLVALKTMLSGSRASDAERSRFQIEAEAIARLRHPNIVQIFDINEHEDFVYIALEFVEGVGLDRWLESGPLPIDTVVGLMRILASAIDYAHQRGVIHRDLKPQNILMEGPPDAPLSDLVPKITDFGLARRMDEGPRLTQTGCVMGTPAYMAPEQARADVEHFGPATDVYSLGVILYELITGRTPFGGRSGLEVLQRVVSQEPDSPATLRPDCPSSLAAITLKCLAKDPADRYETATSLAEDLQRVIDKDTAELIAKPVYKRGAPRMWLATGLTVMFATLLAFAIVAYFSKGKPREPEKPFAPSYAGLAGAAAEFVAHAEQRPIKVGILHSQTGSMAINERPVIDATLLAIDEINSKGGILSRPVVSVIANGRSDAETFAKEAERLIHEEKVQVIFGCWKSSARKAVKEVVERHQNVLFYPVSFEGLEESTNVIYTGALPNQQVLPTVKWCVVFLERKRFFLAGSEQIFSHATNEIIKDELQRLGSLLVGEEYVPYNSTNVEGMIAAIQKSQPDVILSTLTDESIVPFVRGLRSAGITSAKVPMVSFNGADQDLILIDSEHLVGDYLAGGYFQEISTPQNQAFLQMLAARFSPQQIVTDAMEAAYIGVHLWAQAVRNGGSAEPSKVLEQINGLELDAPGGRVRIDPRTHCSYRYARIARIESATELRIVMNSPEAYPPVPFPASRHREDWLRFLAERFERWNGHWTFPPR